MNDLEMQGLKALIKQIIEEETDLDTRLHEVEEDIQELKDGKEKNYEEDPDEDTVEQKPAASPGPKPKEDKLDVPEEDEDEWPTE